MSYSKQLAEIVLEIGAVKIDAQRPFTWASGYKMPVYNDNRLLLGNPEHRALVTAGMQSLITAANIQVNAVAGTATAGIPHATSLANALKTPLIYVRPAPKEHGKQNQIEGILKKGDAVIVVEDLISTGGSALKAVEAVRQAGGKVDHCFCIFHYGFQKAVDQFQQAHCQMHPLLTFELLVQTGQKTGKISAGEKQVLDDWYKNPFEWGR